ncbi:hypothetical protein FRC17_003258, partial [Serendipita sp. 399]
DFAVLGYCEKGIDCNEAHLRECPDFAETGSCKNPRCKLPHVIRANRRRGATANTSSAPPSEAPKEQHTAVKSDPVASSSHDESTDSQQLPLNGVEYTFEGGDEFIPLTFVESEDDEDDEQNSGTDEEEDEDRAEDEEEEEEVEAEMKVFS